MPQPSMPSVPQDVDGNRYATKRAALAEVELAYVDEGPADGVPLLLVHGWPSTRRIWWRNIEPLAESGFRVLAPDLRGFGDSTLAGDGRYDLAAHSRDLRALVGEATGSDVCVAAGGDLGGIVLIDLGLRFPGFVSRQVVFNCPLPYLKKEMAGIADTRVAIEATDYFIRQGTDADGLAAELAGATARRRYVATFYTSRFWAAPGTFDAAAVDFMTEPFADGAKLRASFANYEIAFDRNGVAEPALVGKSPVRTVILFGPQDHVIYPAFDRMAAVVFPYHIGPFVVREAGHFLQWEAPGVFNTTVEGFCADLLAARAG